MTQERRKEIERTLPSVGLLQAGIVRELLREVDALAVEAYFNRRREYSDNPCECWDNRRALAREIATFFELSPERTQELVHFSGSDHGAEGKYLLREVVRRWGPQE